MLSTRLKKFIANVQWPFVVLAAFFLYLVVSGVRDFRQNEQEKQDFLKQWDSLVVGRVVRVGTVETATGLVYLHLDTLVNDRFDVQDYRGGPFLLLTNGNRAKLMTGITNIRREDLVIITREGQLAVVRNGETIESRPIYFYRDAPLLWPRIDTSAVRTGWDW